MNKFFSRVFDVVCFCIGPFLIIASSRHSPGRALGVFLVCLGFLRKYWKNFPNK